MKQKRLLFIPSLVQDRANAVYPFIDFPVLGPISPTVCNALKPILARVEAGINTGIHRLGADSCR
jgi:hypothetical protein